jgi:hypothetical protein
MNLEIDLDLYATLRLDVRVKKGEQGRRSSPSGGKCSLELPAGGGAFFFSGYDSYYLDRELYDCENRRWPV